MKLKRKLFSEDSNKSKKLNRVSTAIQGSAGMGLVLGSNKVSKSIAKKSGAAILDSELTAADKDLVKAKLLESAKNQGIKVIHDPNSSNAAYVGNKSGKQVKDIIAKYVKYLRKKNKGDLAKDELNKIKGGVENLIDSDKVFRNLGKDVIILGDGSLSEADVLAHELGHAQYLRGGRSKSIIGKAAHKLTPVSAISMSTPIGAVGSAINGFRSGQKSVKAKRDGKRESIWNKTRSIAVPTALAAPLLISEGKASLYGLKAMKKAGASKELIAQSKKRLLGAYGTYAGQASKNVMIGAGSREVGKAYEKIKDDIKSNIRERKKRENT